MRAFEVGSSASVAVRMAHKIQVIPILSKTYINMKYSSLSFRFAISVLSIFEKS